MQPVRIGCVAYLNARPLTEGLGADVAFDHPAALVPALRAGRLDVALLPVRSILDDPAAVVADGAGIASEGPVRSVLLAHQGPLAALTRVALDPASVTSAHLVRVVLERFHGVRPDYVGGPDPGDLTPPRAGEGLLKIGDQALAFHARHRDAVGVLDLGEAWTAATGLPFVYALWCFRPGLEHPAPVAARLRKALELGQGAIDRLVVDQADPAFAREYLTRHIRHRIGERERLGLARFASELAALGLLEPGRSPAGWRWV